MPGSSNSSAAAAAPEGVDIQQPASAEEHSQLPQAQKAEGLVGTCNGYHAEVRYLISHTTVLHSERLNSIIACNSVSITALLELL